MQGNAHLTTLAQEWCMQYLLQVFAYGCMYGVLNVVIVNRFPCNNLDSLS